MQRRLALDRRCFIWTRDLYEMEEPQMLRKFALVCAIVAAALFPIAAFAGEHDHHDHGHDNDHEHHVHDYDHDHDHHHHNDNDHDHHHHEGHWYHGHYWEYGVGTCWEPTPIGFVWICGAY